MSHRKVSICILVVMLAAIMMFISCCNYSDKDNSIVDDATNYVYVDSQDGISIISITQIGKEIDIPDRIDGKLVTEIGDSVFENNNTIEKVVLPEGLLKIGKRAFANCSNLKEVIFNQNLVVIEDEAFSNCPSLLSCTIPVSEIQIDESAFETSTEVSFTESKDETSYFGENSLPNSSVPDESNTETSTPDASEPEPRDLDTSESDISEPDTSIPDDTSKSDENQSEKDSLSMDNFVMMYQSDPQYASYPYGDYTVGSHGCGPACMATIIKNFRNVDVTPATMADWAYANGYYAGASGSYHALISAAAKNWGVSCTVTYIYDKEMIRENLESGKLLLVIMGPGEFTTKGHYMLIRGFSEDGKLLIGDTQSPENTENLWDFDFIYSELKTGSPIWIFE